MNEGITFRLNENDEWEVYDPYITIDVQTKEDYDFLVKALEHYKEASKAAATEIFDEIDKILDETYNRHIFGPEDLEDEEKEAVMNFHNDVWTRVEELKKRYLEEADNGKP